MFFSAKRLPHSVRRTRDRNDPSVDAYIQRRVDQAEESRQAGVPIPSSHSQRQEELVEQARWRDHLERKALIALWSLIVHLALLICVAFVTYRTVENEPIELALTQSKDDPPEALDTLELEVVDDPKVEPTPPEIVEVTVPTDFTPAEVDVATVIAEPEPEAPQVQLTGVQQGPVSKGVSEDGEPGTKARMEFDTRVPDYLQDIYENGIDIVVVFDSTGSMSGEINVVKRRIDAIGQAVLSKIPKARFSLVTNRDTGDVFKARGSRLSDSVPRLKRFISGVYADGGGDRPEAVDAGMNLALYRNQFRPKAHKVMLIFGDAPPHSFRMQACTRIAHNFRDLGKARVHTITCKAPRPMMEFYEISQAGGGNAYVLYQMDRLMEEILVIAFGPEHPQEVLEFFQLDRPRI